MDVRLLPNSVRPLRPTPPSDPYAVPPSVCPSPSGVGAMIRVRTGAA